MDLLPKTLEICDKYNIKPERSKGQNFLINEDIYDKIIDIADLKSDDIVLEIGPGLGFLTYKLATKVKKVITVEIDPLLAKILKENLKEKKINNVTIFNNDILKARGTNFSKLGKYKVVSNLPYNITSIFLRKFLSLNNKPQAIILMLQKEVVERIIAQVPKMSLLACSVQFYAEAKLMLDVSKDNFYPKPKVDSAIIKIIPNKKLLANYEEEKDFFKLLRIAYSSKRKMLKNNLTSGLKMSSLDIYNLLKQANLDEKVRSEQLSIEDWLKIYSFLKKSS
ncbi:MAG TPA: 16S rRNA (adenine(1518)-N(6)/adenine(1519)-N(6))-dimethyltransferase RsmA [bacterium]|nr:16S rRNA (adenine(1518)-N(6)/adenine(1519)-N(6))-dimethyltransferase RsmA [bacterium]